ncbi:MAG: antitoxin [Candidatus Marinimicrobia bacterium]|nr:antitoxin [Candidatus Neomarinimicrobiota bacterium]
MNKHTDYEKEILESYENDEWISTSDIESDKKKYSQIARNTILKNKRINIRISEKDLTKLKSKSVEEGLPYQTLISSILHKYLSGKLIEQR